jgi:K+-transporting ATPase ATPase B chain
MQNPVESIESFTVQRNDRKHKPAAFNQSLILQQALTGMVTKLDPRLMIKNPVMFVVEIGFLLTLAMSFQPQIFGPTLVTQSYVVGVMAILFVTLLFANFAEAYAEGRGVCRGPRQGPSRQLEKNTLHHSGSINTG